MHKTSWDDLKYVLAVAQTGTLSGAARLTGVTHATVLRRVAAFEQTHGVRLFRRSGSGYRMTPEAARLVDRMREVRRAVLRLGQEIGGIAQALDGTVRLTSSDSLFAGPIPALLAAFRDREPGIVVETVATNQVLDMEAATADVTVRPATALPPHLVGEKAARLRLRVFGRRDEAAHDNWIGFASVLRESLPARWVAEHVAESRIALRTDSFVVMRELVASGAGVGYLPVFLTYGRPELVPLFDLGPPIDIDVWVACHRDQAQVPRVAALCRFLREGLRSRAAYMAGD